MNWFLLAQTGDGNGGTDTAKDAAGAAKEIVGDGQQLWDTIVEFVSTRGVEFGINVLAALVIFLIGRWLAQLLTASVRKLMTRADVDETLVTFVGNLFYITLLVVVILAALGRLGVQTTSFAAIIAAAGLAVGFALQGSLANFAAGVMLILFKPFKVGDFVEAAGCKGVVEEIQIFSTMMRTGDNVQMIIPNAHVTGGTITNFSAKETRRVDLIVGCGYGDDLKAVKQFLTDLLSGDERILKDPEPVVAVHELGDSSVNFVVRPWVSWGVKWDLTEKIKLGFDERGFNIPYPTQDVHLHGTTAQAG